VVEVKSPAPVKANTEQEISESARTLPSIEQLKPPSVNQAREIVPPAAQAVPDLTNAAGAQELADLERKTRADNDAWAAVNPADLHSVESYLSRFPGGANYASAERAVADIQRADARRRQSAEVLAAVRQYAEAWSARNIDSILSIQRYLDRRAVKAQLSPLKSLVMNVAPYGEPSIDGEQATVRCRRQISEVFEDGVAKQTVEQTVTFVLGKRDGAWTIEGTRQ
jgi:hypothetical protein